MKYTLNPKYKSYLPLVEGIESYFESSNEVLYDKRNKIRVVYYNNESYVVKAFKVPNVINRFVYRFFRKSKAERSYLYSLRIGSSLAPEPVAYLEETGIFTLGKSYYISELFYYDHTIHEVLTNKMLVDRKAILKAFADFTFLLHEKQILHKDYSHGNILIKRFDENPLEYDLKIIDINRMQFKTLNIQERLENFAKIKADDDDMEIIIKQYLSHLNLPLDKHLSKALFYRDNFYKKRAIKNKLRGKIETPH